MEKAGEWDQDSLINELTQARELVNQLKQHLDHSISRETFEFLVEKILTSYDKALSMVKWSAFADEPQPEMGSILLSSLGSTPGDEVSNRDCKNQCLKDDVSKKRNTVLLWTEQVRVCSGTEREGPPDDGYSWRKYGQKDILGANFPRAYYRCTQSNVQGCLAKKLVQRSNQDLSVFEVTYRGRHTCLPSSHWNVALASSEREELQPRQDHNQRLQEKLGKSQEVLLNCGTDLKIKTEDLSSMEETFPFLSHPSMPVESKMEDSDTPKKNSLIGSSFLACRSPESSKSNNYFSLSPCLANKFGMDQNLQISESDLTEIMFAPTSVINSPIEDLNFLLDQEDFDTSFPFDTTE